MSNDRAITRELAGFVAGCRFDDLPPAVVRMTTRTLVDAVGCALGGHVTDKAKIALGHVRELGGNPQASIIGDGKTSWSLAAFANAELINALDYDPIGPVVSHVSPYVIPSCLAAAERVGASGKDLIMAVALAHELSGRFGGSLALHRIPKEEPPYYEYSPRFSFTLNIFGAVAGAARLLGLGEEKIANAFGIAGASTPVPAGMKWEMTGGPAMMVKYGCWSGWLAKLAIEAVLLAEKGFTGDSTILDGDWGFWKIYGSPYFRTNVLLDNLGKVWHEENLIKPYPCCGATHAGIDGLNLLIEQNGLRPEEIEKIVVKGDCFLLTPNRGQTEIASYQDTQFANAYIYAVAAYYGRKPGAYWQAPATYQDPRIVNLMGRVRMEEHPRLNELMAAEIKAGRLAVRPRNTIVEVTARGKTFSTEVTVRKGSVAKPLTTEELKAKFLDNAHYSPMARERAETLVKALLELPTAADVREVPLTA